MSAHRYAYLEPGRYARGWHLLLFSSELPAGEVKALRYFERDLVAFRGDSGAVGVVDAHCPHLGAHLASGGGRINGDTIACPFHGWRFDTTGRCVEIPYAKSIPARAEQALQGWPVIEKNGFIAIWYDAEGGSPQEYLPDIGSWGPQGWGDWTFRRSRINAMACDVIENIVDIAHFPHIHGGFVREFENTFGEFTVTQRSKVDRDPAAQMIVPPGLDFDLADTRNDQAGEAADAWGDATYHGPSIMYYYTESRSEDISFRAWWVNTHTPVDQGKLDLCSAVIVSSLDERPLPEEFAQMYPEMAHIAFGQDVEIWRDKVYREDPILCDGDGPINKLRKWYERFYLPRS